MGNLTSFQSSLFYLAGITVLVVVIVLFYSLMTFKKNKGEEEGNLKVEMFWTVIPFIMLFLISVPVIKTYFFKPAPKNAVVSTENFGGSNDSR